VAAGAGDRGVVIRSFMEDLLVGRWSADCNRHIPPRASLGRDRLGVARRASVRHWFQIAI
jgi:hypothetical protein